MQRRNIPRDQALGFKVAENRRHCLRRDERSSSKLSGRLTGRLSECCQSRVLGYRQLEVAQGTSLLPHKEVLDPFNPITETQGHVTDALRLLRVAFHISPTFTAFIRLVTMRSSITGNTDISAAVADHARCPRRDSNPHARRQRLLRSRCLPIPPRGLGTPEVSPGASTPTGIRTQDHVLIRHARGISSLL